MDKEGTTEPDQTTVFSDIVEAIGFSTRGLYIRQSDQAFFVHVLERCHEGVLAISRLD